MQNKRRKTNCQKFSFHCHPHLRGSEQSESSEASDTHKYLGRTLGLRGSRPGPHPGRTLLSRQVKKPFPFPACRAKGGKHGAVGAQGRGANPEERKKCRQRNEQRQRHGGAGVTTHSGSEGSKG